MCIYYEKKEVRHKFGPHSISVSETNGDSSEWDKNGDLIIIIHCFVYKNEIRNKEIRKDVSIIWNNEFHACRVVTMYIETIYIWFFCITYFLFYL